MKKIRFTRLAGLLLIAGFFYSCASTRPNIDELINNENYSAALNELDKQIRQNPANPGLYIKRADVTAKLAQNEAPEYRLEYYFQVSDDLNFTEDLGISNTQRNAVDSLKQHYWQAEHNSGLQSSETQPTAASAHFQNAIQLRPEALSSYQNLSVLQFSNGEIDAAIETLMQALNNIENPPASLYENLGYLYLEKGDAAEAVHYYELANTNLEEDLNLTFGLVNAYISKGNSEEALALLQPLVEENPENADIRNVYGTQLYSITAQILGELKTAYEEADSVLADQLRLDAIAMAEEAETNLQEAFRRDTLNSKYIESLAVFYNNLAGQYFALENVAFEEHKPEITERALLLVDYAINYYSRLEAVEPSNEEYKTKLNSLRRLKENRSVQPDQ